MSCQDGFITGHGVERVGMLPDEAVKEFVGQYEPKHCLLDIDHPVTMGAWDFTDYYFEHKRQQTEAINNALPIIEAVSEEYAKLSGRPQPILDMLRHGRRRVSPSSCSAPPPAPRAPWRASCAPRASRSAWSSRASIRPFPAKQIVDAIKDCKAVAVLDRAISFGAPQGMGPLFTDVTSALYNQGVCGLNIVNYILVWAAATPCRRMIESRLQRSASHRRHRRARRAGALPGPARLRRCTDAPHRIARRDTS